jgi:CRISPR-associated protein Cmr3
MMANRYLVQLTPVGKYYFGSENSFNAEDKAGGGATKNYLVRSRQYPQQTTLLGMMRYAILQQYGLLQQPQSEWAAKIGAHSFNGLQPDANGNRVSNWGLIQQISPLFLLIDGQMFLPAGISLQLYKKDKSLGQVALMPQGRSGAVADYCTDEFYWFEQYDPKQQACMLWKQHNGSALLQPSDIFIGCFQVGITKSRQGAPDEDAFYKEYFYQLKRGAAFAFYVTTSEPLQHFEKPLLIQSGGDQSLFHLQLSEASDNIFETTQATGKGKFTLLSDAFVKADEVLPLCTACITQSVDFRYMQTTTATGRYYNVSKKAGDMRKSEKLNLLERGSVLFTDRAEELEKVLNSPDIAPYRHAGFNYYSFEKIN